MDSFDSSTGIFGTAVLGGGYALYKFWQVIKQDNKGNTVDARIDSFTKTLQAQLDKATEKLDKLATEKYMLEGENALLKAKLTIAEAEIVHLRASFDKSA